MNYLEQIEGQVLQLSALADRYRKAMKAKNYDPDIFTPVGWGNVVCFRCGIFYIHEMGGQVRVTAGHIEIGMCRRWSDAFSMVANSIASRSDGIIITS